MSDLASAVAKIAQWLPLIPLLEELFDSPKDAKVGLRRWRKWELDQRAARDKRLAAQKRT